MIFSQFQILTKALNFGDTLFECAVAIETRTSNWINNMFLDKCKEKSQSLTNMPSTTIMDRSSCGNSCNAVTYHAFDVWSLKKHCYSRCCFYLVAFAFSLPNAMSNLWRIHGYKFPTWYVEHVWRKGGGKGRGPDRWSGTRFWRVCN